MYRPDLYICHDVTETFVVYYITAHHKFTPQVDG